MNQQSVDYKNHTVQQAKSHITNYDACIER